MEPTPLTPEQARALGLEDDEPTPLTHEQAVELGLEDGPAPERSFLTKAKDAMTRASDVGAGSAALGPLGAAAQLKAGYEGWTGEHSDAIDGLTDFGRGAVQGATLGFGDEIKGGLSALGGEDYTQVRDATRAENAASQEASPWLYGGGQVAGGMVLPMPGGAAKGLLGVGKAALSGAGMGMASHIGNAAELEDVNAGEVATSGLIGGALGAAGNLVGQGVGKFRGWLANKVSQADDAGLAAAEALKIEQANSAGGSLGGEVQKGNRLVENLDRLEPDMNTAQAYRQANLDRAAVPDLKKRLIDSNQADLPNQAATIDAKRALFDKLKQNVKPDAAAMWGGQKEGALKGMLGAGQGAAGSSAKSLAVAGVGAGIGGYLGGMVGMPFVGAAVGSGAAHAIAGTLKTPQVQYRLFSMLEKAASKSQGPMQRYLPKLSAAGERSYEALAALHWSLWQQDPAYREAVRETEGAAAR